DTKWDTFTCYRVIYKIKSQQVRWSSVHLQSLRRLLKTHSMRKRQSSKFLSKILAWMLLKLSIMVLELTMTSGSCSLNATRLRSLVKPMTYLQFVHLEVGEEHSEVLERSLK